MSDAHNQGQFETRAVHAGQPIDPQTGAVMTPVYFTSTYAQSEPGKPIGGYEYSRTHNPTRTALQDNLANLEGGKFGLAFSSGLAATNALMDLLVPGDKVVCGDDLYGGTYRIFTKVFERYGIEFVFVDTTDLAAVKAAVDKKTKMVYIETPSNPLLRLTDIAGCSQVAKSVGAMLVVDNTFATPYLQRPIEMGADVVLHSLSKYLGGHSDVIGGALIVNDQKLNDDLAFYQNSVGGTPGPMDAFLVLRGTKTLAVRMDRHCENALKVAQYLEIHPQVDRVFYPGLPSHPQHAIFQKQMSAGGGMVSFELKGGVEAGNRCASTTKIFTLAESLGGVESLIETPPSMTHASIPPAVRHAAGLNDGLVRLSVGIENADDLIADLKQAIG